MNVKVMERTVRHSSAASDLHDGRKRTTGGEVLLQLPDKTLSGVLEEVEDSLTAALEARPHTMAVDMSRVRHLSSTTVAALLWIKRRSKARGIQVVLRDTSPSIADGLHRAGLVGVLAVEPSSASPPSSRAT